MPLSLERELDTARELARGAWDRIRKYYGGPLEVTEKPDGPATIADREANRYILDALASRFPGDAILSEEETDNERRFSSERLWIVDPIDGTKGFIWRTGDFVIQIGLCVRDEEGYTPRLGAVYHPAKDHLYYARFAAGAWIESGHDQAPRRLGVTRESDPTRMTAVVTRSHRTPRFLEMMGLLGLKDTITMGSMGLKIVWVAAGRADFYLNNARGMCKEWDVCAPDAILREAGGSLTDLRGLPLRYNQPDPRVEHGVLAGNGSRQDELRRHILKHEGAIREKYEVKS